MLNLSNQENFNIINKLYLENYRNHSKLNLDSDGKSVLIYGSNGTGKTSILEAISVFSNTKGIRNAKLNEMIKRNRNYFSVNIQLKINNIISSQISCVYEEKKKKRKYFLDGKEANSLSKLKKIIPLLSIAPYNEKIFNGAASLRRDFIDGLANNFDLYHSKRIAEYERYLKERSILLKEGNNDSNWLSSIEDSLAKLSVAICSTRLDVIIRISELLKKPLENFPKVSITVDNSIESLLKEKPAIDVEEELRNKFYTSRKIDAILGGSREGCQRSDINICNLDKSMKAKMCSSGEQKTLLITIVLACSRAIKESTNVSPIILLDEIFTHLDLKRKKSLLNELIQLGSQIWITTTEKESFIQKDHNFCYYSLNNNFLK